MTMRKINETMRNTVERMADRELSVSTKSYLENTTETIRNRNNHGVESKNSNGHVINMYLG